MKKGVIAFIDALGVKGLWARSDPKAFIRSWKAILRLFSASRKVISKEYQYSSKQIIIKAFSDTIIIAFITKDNPIDHILFMGDLLMTPFYHALGIGIFFRGVISIGQFEISESIILGPAIDEAAQWHAKPDWFGISLTPSAAYGLEQLIIDKGVDYSNIFIEYDIPIKSGIDSFKSFSLNWPYNLVSFVKTYRQHVPFGRSVLLEAFSKSLIGVDDYIKYRNTIAFWDYVMEKTK